MRAVAQARPAPQHEVPSSAAVRALTIPSNWSEFGQTPQFRQGPDSSRLGYYSVRSVVPRMRTVADRRRQQRLAEVHGQLRAVGVPDRELALEVRFRRAHARVPDAHAVAAARHVASPSAALVDRKSTRLNSSHSSISYAVFCL